MTVEKAISELLKSEEFKSEAKQPDKGKLRVYLGRYNKGTLGQCGMIELLETFGYKVEIIPPKK